MTMTMPDDLQIETIACATPDRGDHDPMRALADLVSLAGLVDELSERAHHQLAAWPTVTAHLGMAREHLAMLHRSLHHAEATLAFNSGHRA